MFTDHTSALGSMSVYLKYFRIVHVCVIYEFGSLTTFTYTKVFTNT